ncbi:MAG: hypothetical protein Q7T04_07560 [Dehalococcoidia bacterium]|nr:hypothetical protein [Dehalococcoidia bacterium]
MHAIWIMLSNCTDPARDAEFNEWYNKMHIPDLTATPGILSGKRYKNMRPQLAPDEPLYMALYTVEWDDPWALLRKVAQVDDLKRAAQGRMIDCLQARLLSAWQPLGVRRYASAQLQKAGAGGGAPRALMLVLANPAEGVSDSDFEKWFSSAYLPRLLKMPGAAWGERYRTLRPNRRPGDCKYMALLAVESKDPAGLLDKVAGAAPAKGPQTDPLQVCYHSVFKHIGP